MKHGASAYANGYCRCRECRSANTERQRRSVARRTALLRAGKADVVHGKYSTYRNWGCRCDECRATHAATLRKRNQRTRAAS